MFGKQTFANGLLRWCSVPLVRVGTLLIAVPIVVDGHATWVSTVGVCVVVISLIAATTNFILMRRGRPKATDRLRRANAADTAPGAGHPTPA
jgi:hypothetical protein